MICIHPKAEGQTDGEYACISCRLLLLFLLFLLVFQLEVKAYQPVDIVTRTVEVPVTRTVDVYVPKPVVREKIVQVPKLVPKYIEKVGLEALGFRV